VSFLDKVVWITGGAQGFGAGVARRVAADGAHVVVSDLNAERGKSVADEIGGRFVPCDVGNLDDNLAAVQATVEACGRLDVAFLNAGIAIATRVDTFDLAEYRRAMSVNLDGVVFGAHAAYTVMKDNGGGDIVATASLAGLVGTAFDPIYGANKHAVVGLVRAIGDDWPGLHDIRVNAICPGFADTAIVDPMRDILQAGGITLLTVDAVVDAFVAAATSGRSAECWYVQPGRPSEPFRFRGVPGPRADPE
jgi:NAD(P)-dependent dehydrogenase (short-subunit alcohol dehydrogenase family)